MEASWAFESSQRLRAAGAAAVVAALSGQTAAGSFKLEGKQRREFGPEQMAKLMVERSRRAQAGAARIGGSADNDTGAGPPHWYEHLEAVNSRPWLRIAKLRTRTRT